MHGGIVEHRPSCLAGQRAVLRHLPAAVIPDVIALLAERRLFVEPLRQRAVVADDEHRRDAVLRGGLEIPVYMLHVRIVLAAPDGEIADDPYRVEAYRRGEAEFLVGGREPCLETVFLPLVDAVGAVGRHEVASAQPRAGIIPFPRLFGRPSLFFAHGHPNISSKR